MRAKPDLLELLAVAAIAIFVAACSVAGPASTPAGGSASALASATTSASTSATASPSATLISTGPLTTVEVRGGLCPAAGCDQTVYLERDGRIHVSAKPPNDVGTATPAEVATLEAAIAATDFAALRRHPFMSQCPTWLDAPEMVFEFAASTGTERLAGCETALDFTTPLFRALAAALGPASPFRAP